MSLFEGWASCGGSGLHSALHITIKYGDKVIYRVLLDGGSGVNIYPFSILWELGIHIRKVKEIHVRVRSFNGSHKEVIGEIFLAFQVKHIEFSMLIQLMDIPSSYNTLLGRSQIHMEREVPSTLHQCMKFEWDCQEIVIHGEWSHLAYSEHVVPFIEGLDRVTFHEVDIMQIVKMEKN